MFVQFLFIKSKEVTLLKRSGIVMLVNQSDLSIHIRALKS